jgi:hypothetical protein
MTFRRLKPIIPACPSSLANEQQSSSVTFKVALQISKEEEGNHAKAQEYGKGFAIVASEVRALVERTRMAAIEINSVASESIDEIPLPNSHNVPDHR